MGGFYKNIALVALGFWLGCAILFVAVVAPVLFNPDVTSGLSREMAGAIAGAIIGRIYLITYICIGTSAFFILLALWSMGFYGNKRLLYTFILCLTVLGLNIASDLWIRPQLYKIRLEITNSTGSSTALQEKFKKWHTFSEWTYGAAVGCGLLGTILLIPSGWGGKTRKTSR